MSENQSSEPQKNQSGDGQAKKQLTGRVEQVGEFGLIRYLTEDLKITRPTTVFGVGDDAAVLDYKDKAVLVSSDMLIEGVHFDLTYMPLHYLGYKTAVVNFSDIYAMNGLAEQFIIDLAVSNYFDLEAIDKFMSGVKQACENYEVDLVGGDTTSALRGMQLAGTAVGGAEKNKVVYRHGAKPNDLIIVTGDLGAAYMGLQILRRENEIFQVNPQHQPDLVPYEYIIQRQLRPEARKDVILWLDKHGIVPTSMIDISDGLSSEVIHITQRSGYGAWIYEEKIPIDPVTKSAAEELNINPLIAALNGGEDYELLFTIAQKDYEKIKDIPGFSIIGHITEDPGAYLITKLNEKIPLTAQGWDAFLRGNKED